MTEQTQDENKLIAERRAKLSHIREIAHQMVSPMTLGVNFTVMNYNKLLAIMKNPL